MGYRGILWDESWVRADHLPFLICHFSFAIALSLLAKGQRTKVRSHFHFQFTVFNVHSPLSCQRLFGLTGLLRAAYFYLNQ
jgi:hypothetical protein